MLTTKLPKEIFGCAGQKVKRQISPHISSFGHCYWGMGPHKSGETYGLFLAGNSLWQDHITIPGEKEEDDKAHFHDFHITLTPGPGVLAAKKSLHFYFANKSCLPLLTFYVQGKHGAFKVASDWNYLDEGEQLSVVRIAQKFWTQIPHNKEQKLLKVD